MDSGAGQQGPPGPAAAAAAEVRAATPADLPAIAQLYASAFDSNPGYRWIFTGDPQQPAPEGALPWLFLRRARMLLQRRCPLLVAYSREGELVAAGGIIPFDRKPGHWDFLKNGILMWIPWYGLASLRRALSMDGGLAALRASGALEGVAGELSMVAVRPDLQGRGLGRKLLSDLLRRWDAEDGRALLMMTQDHRALRMYARCGFEPLEGGPSEEKHPQGGFSNWVRLRPGRQQSGDE